MRTSRDAFVPILIAVFVVGFMGDVLLAEDESADGKSETTQEEIAPGHSAHGEVFDEGPRQSAYLMPGMPNVNFPAKTDKPECQKFINQGVGQLHGFWTFEAERSFRQAAAIDPDCAIAYWGMAMCNLRNEKRSKGFIAEAVKRRDGIPDRERKYIDALNAYIKAGAAKKKERAEKYTSALESIALAFPDDVEAKAFLALQLWKNGREGVKIQSYLAINGLLDQVFAVNPMHPAHHYRIHLWDSKKAELAIESTAKCGLSAPGIAHMWHMPGHILSKLKRYEDAAWYQEASARVDHAHMMRDRVLPDQIHNYAHNNEWCCRNLMNVGRVDDALALAKNMLELPRHPKYNTPSKGGSSSNYGRKRVLDVLTKFELWEQLAEADKKGLVPETGKTDEHVDYWYWATVAYLKTDDEEGAKKSRTRIENALADAKKTVADIEEQEAAEKQKAEAAKAAEEAAKAKEAEGGKAEGEKTAGEVTPSEEDKSETSESSDNASDSKEAKTENTEGQAKPEDASAQQDADSDTSKTCDDEADDKESAGDAEAKTKTAEELKKEKEERKKKLDEAKKRIKRTETKLLELDFLQHVHAEEFDAAKDKLDKVKGMDKMLLAHARLQLGETKPVIDHAKSLVKRDITQVLPAAQAAYLLEAAGDQEEADKAFQKLLPVSSVLDLESPIFARLEPIAARAKLTGDWRKKREPPTDLLDRPELDSLGPFRWQPTNAPEWELKDADGNVRAIGDYHGRGVLVLFYLGFGCMHCVDQLHAFSPEAKAFSEIGVDIIGISTESELELVTDLTEYRDQGKDIMFPLVANEKLDIFKKYRAHDGFEDQPLHGAFLIDPNSQIRWFDIGYEPFMDVKFLKEEAKRMLAN